MSKQAERDFPLHVDPKILYRKPFNCPRVLREFGLVLDILRGHVPPNHAVLDLGCGSGWTSLFLARGGYRVVGVDISERMIEIARDRARLDGVDVPFHAADMEELDLPQKDFDAVLLFDALHHCPGYARVLERAAAHLKPGGYLLLPEPSWLHLISPSARAFSRKYGVTELGFTRWGLDWVLKRAGFRRTAHFYDPGPVYRGFFGFLLAWLRVGFGYLGCYPQAKQIVLAQK